MHEDACMHTHTTYTPNSLHNHTHPRPPTQVVDEAGLPVPGANHTVTFSLSTQDGDSVTRLVGTGNGDPSDHTPDHSASRPAFHGLVAALVQTNAAKVEGAFTITASAPGLEASSLVILKYWLY